MDRLLLLRQQRKEARVSKAQLDKEEEADNERKRGLANTTDFQWYWNKFILPKTKRPSLSKKAEVNTTLMYNIIEAEVYESIYRDLMRFVEKGV